MPTDNLLLIPYSVWLTDARQLEQQPLHLNSELNHSALTPCGREVYSSNTAGKTIYPGKIWGGLNCKL